MHVGLISYQVGHRKTWTLARRYQLKGYRVTIYGFPFVYRNPPVAIFKDRPDQIVDFNVEEMARHFGFDYVAVGGWTEDHSRQLTIAGELPDVFITCIGKIIPAPFLANRIFLNAHPGLLPQNRGLDAFKWAVINGWPIGVTLHRIDERIDAGRILRRVRVPIFPSDDLVDVAMRSYELECDLLSDFSLWLDNKENVAWDVDVAKYNLSKVRVTEEQNRDLPQLFRTNRAHFVSLSVDLSIQPHPSDLTFALPV